MTARRKRQGKNVLLMRAQLADPFGRSSGTVYRTVAVLDNFTLYEVAETIVGSFGFDCDHSFGFYDNLENWTKSTEGYELFTDMGQGSGFKGVSTVEVGTVFSEVGKKMLFLFDYGDEWCFVLELVGTAQVQDKKKYPFVVESKGKAPEQYGAMEDDE